MLNFCCKRDLTGCLIDYCQPGLFRAGINLDPKVGRLSILDYAFQDDGERRSPEDSGLAFLQEKPCSYCRSRRQRSFVLINDCYLHVENGPFEPLAYLP